MGIRSFAGITPTVGNNTFIDDTALVLGDVVMGEDCSVWPMTVIRGDVNWIRIGARTNVQDNCSLHVTGGRHPLQIGEEASIGHRAVVHGCTVGDRVLVGMGAVLLDGVQIGDDSVVGAGAVVPEGMHVPPGSLVMGVPGRIVRPVTPELRERITGTWEHYVAQARDHRAGKYPMV